jgi:hypothetical protein
MDGNPVAILVMAVTALMTLAAGLVGLVRWAWWRA